MRSMGKLRGSLAGINLDALSGADAYLSVARAWQRHGEAELLRRLDRREEAREAFEHALRLAATEPERRFLARRLAGL